MSEGIEHIYVLCASRSAQSIWEEGGLLGPMISDIKYMCDLIANNSQVSLRLHILFFFPVIGSYNHKGN